MFTLENDAFLKSEKEEFIIHNTKEEDNQLIMSGNIKDRLDFDDKDEVQEEIDYLDTECIIVPDIGDD